MTPEQEKVHFDTFGFIIKRSLFSPKEMEMFSRWFDEGCDAKCGPFVGAGQMGYPGLGIHEGFCHHYLDDPCIMDTLDNLMGEGFQLVASDAQRHGGNTSWHQDTAIPMEAGKEIEYLMLKVIMYLDDHSDGPGCLWLLPGTHRRGYGRGAARNDDEGQSYRRRRLNAGGRAANGYSRRNRYEDPPGRHHLFQPEARSLLVGWTAGPPLLRDYLRWEADGGLAGRMARQSRRAMET